MTELYRMSGPSRMIVGLVRAGKAIVIDHVRVNNETETVRALKICKSDDEHVIALARLSGARLLCTEDADLMSDFKNLTLVPSPKGRIYRKAAHKIMLSHTNSCRGVGFSSVAAPSGPGPRR
jgi:hypothetical protein